MSTFKHVSNLWNDAEAAKLTGADRLVYRSNKLGSDQRMFELVAVIAAYNMVARILVAMRLEP